MKRNYEEPEMEVLLLEFADVMNQSTPTTEENELGPFCHHVCDRRRSEQ